MDSIVLVAVFFALALFIVNYLFLYPFYFSPLSHIPGPKTYALTSWRLSYEDWKGTRTRTLNTLHQTYGPAVRIGPNEVSFNSLTALRAIYGPGSGYGRTSFYRMFEVYGRRNLFTFHSSQEHSERKKLLAHAYSKSALLKGPSANMVEEKAWKYIGLIESEPGRVSEIFTTLHYFSLDNITSFLYGHYGATSAMEGSSAHRALISDIMNPSRRTLSWCTVHLPEITKWLYTRTGLMETIVKPILPMQKPSTYTGVRDFTLETFYRFKQDMMNHERCTSQEVKEVNKSFLLGRLWCYHRTQRPNGMDDLDMASECSDHLLAGIDTTSDTLMFLIWTLSLPENRHVQQKLRLEILNLPQASLNSYGLPTAKTSDECIYLNAVIKETLRLFAPLPTTEPRSMSRESVIDGYAIPSDTIVEMCPYTLHRNGDIFQDPLVFNPDRWMGPHVSELNKWFWAFSSGGRMCIGMHLAMAEMTTLLAAIYQRYETCIGPGFEGVSPGAIVRFEVFYDDSFAKMEEHRCFIEFTQVRQS